jgi:hypothetical protein
MSRSSYIYTCIPKDRVAIACTVKYEFLNRVQQAVDAGNLKIGEFTLMRTPDNGLFGNGADITADYELDRSKQF